MLGCDHSFGGGAPVCDDSGADTIFTEMTMCMISRTVYVSYVGKLIY